MAMITSVWPLDTQISDLDSAGLPAKSLIRLKLFTLDQRLIVNTLGQLSINHQTMFKQPCTLLLEFIN